MHEPLPPTLFFNRELSWLEFNARVLNEAFDERNPLLERLKFLSIFSTNLDEFYMVRVAGLRRQVAAGVTSSAADGLSPQPALDAIERRVRELLAQARTILHEQLLPALDEKGIRLVRMTDLAPSEWNTIDQFFESEVFPVLTPLAVDPGHPFPYVSNLSLSLAVEIRDPDRGLDHFARVKVPKSLPRWVAFGRGHHFVPLEEVIGANLGSLFPGMQVLGWWAFKVTRYSDLELEKNVDEPEDLLAMIEEQVFQRRFGEVVRLEVQDDMPRHIRALILEELQEAELLPGLVLADRDMFDGGPLLELGDLMSIASIDMPELHDPPFVPAVPPAVRDATRSIFDVIRERDLLVHHPYESFTATVEQFLDAASRDDHVLAIKMTLYRTSGDTPIVRALTEAAQRGKQVAVLVELQARFDEANNITWARTLENFGVHVAYGLPGLKTHSKVALVVRREPDGIRRYVHIGTGNYNATTAQIYTDFGLFTSDPEVGDDVQDVFNYLTGYSKRKEYRELLIAPVSLRARFLALLERELDHARNGRPAHVIAKNNAVTDPAVIRALYRAAQAGVEIDLVVRGACCLKPGLAGVSDRIRVRSVVGRFLEHSRVYWFANGGQPEVYIGSADLMERNLDRRVEALCRVREGVLADHIRTVALAAYLRDTERSFVLNGVRDDAASANGGPSLNAQQHLLEWYTTPPPDDDIAARP